MLLPTSRPLTPNILSHGRTEQRKAIDLGKKLYEDYGSAITSQLEADILSAASHAIVRK